MLGNQEGRLLMRARQTQSGFSIIELMIAIAVLGVLLGVGMPSMFTWLQNSQIRTASETLLTGLNLARNEAVRRNVTVRFTLTTTLDASCAASAGGPNWVVSLADPTTGTNKCAEVPSDTVVPQIVQSKSAAEGTPNAVINATGGSSMWFNGLGRASAANAANITQIDITNPSGGNCQGGPAGPMRCMRIIVSTGGQVKMCDPAVTSNTDPRSCS